MFDWGGMMVWTWGIMFRSRKNLPLNRYLNPKKLATHNYPMPAVTAQGKPNPELNTVKDGRHWGFCVVIPNKINSENN